VSVVSIVAIPILDFAGTQ